MLNIKNISLKKDKKLILNNININIDNNKLIVITGPNGSGKSSLAKIIMGINKPTNGKIIFNDKDITNYSIDKRANLGFSYAYQTPINFKGIKINDLFKSVNKDVLFVDVKKYLRLVGLCAKDYINREFNDSLSGGEKKRIEVALILYKGGLINIFDEPEAGIDLWNFDKLVKIFKKHNNNITIIISHQEKILDIADEIILLEDGKIIKSGEKEKVLKYINDKSLKLGDDNE